MNFDQQAPICQRLADFIHQDMLFEGLSADCYAPSRTDLLRVWSEHPGSTNGRKNEGVGSSDDNSRITRINSCIQT